MTNVRGFTLVEMVVVLVVMAVLTVSVAFRGSGGGNISQGSQGQQLAADLRYVQSLSMTRSTPSGGARRYCVQFTSSSYQIAADNDNDNICETAVTHPATGTTAPITLDSGTLSWTNLPSNYIAFDGKGAPFTDATTLLAAVATISLTAGADTTTVQINPETGRVAMQ